MGLRVDNAERALDVLRHQLLVEIRFQISPSCPVDLFECPEVGEGYFIWSYAYNGPYDALD